MDALKVCTCEKFRALRRTNDARRRDDVTKIARFEQSCQTVGAESRIRLESRTVMGFTSETPPRWCLGVQLDSECLSLCVTLHSLLDSCDLKLAFKVQKKRTERQSFSASERRRRCRATKWFGRFAIFVT